MVKEARPGWLSLELPPLEMWEEPLKRLSVQQRERIESPEFYRMLQREVTRRYLAAPAVPVEPFGSLNEPSSIPFATRVRPPAAHWRVCSCHSGQESGESRHRCCQRGSLVDSEPLFTTV